MFVDVGASVVVAVVVIVDASLHPRLAAAWWGFAMLDSTKKHNYSRTYFFYSKVTLQRLLLPLQYYYS